MSEVQHVTIPITGMSCGHCVARVKQALQGVPGVADAQVEIGSARLTVAGASGEQVAADARRAIETAGYEAA